MKHSIKIAMASLLVLGSSQVNATEVDLDVTDILTSSVTSYIKQTTIELEKSIKDTLYFDTKLTLESLIEPADLVSNEVAESTNPAVKTAK
ncbi:MULTISPECIES: hypothetical protein [unclassified Pseudoalteromonas]|uniref:hypothetical protein n=1 Tax=unclassified Pseudoalteromonas TaxID=194690 RepID=UPI0011081CCC|nr:MULTISPECIES: hypothetical protein [unclassified Pseudoalteromonas]TMN84549.1 hypothetical protein CWB64_03950 [Pseudoalteromonas sp. S410]TMN91234.1 hypothetical protein CWB62_08040 [Pseudoalteromonas sp. S408]TMN98113.1 hypothetical protein CWB61_08630 [Pseudoalteromonas sp. S407]TMN99998.1 hypothetical protein CWB63_08540 [Pseudoalteromonas sp. S409]TMO11802.1 hypothetical protein CWB57_05630 [Pseudoalteromonas sp. S186]